MKARRSESVQGLVADEFAPGERPRAGIQHALHRLRDLREWPLDAVELELPALDAGKADLQRARQSRSWDAPAMISIRGAADSNWLVIRATSASEEQQPFFFKEFSGTERLNGTEMLGVAGQLLLKCRARRGREFRCWSVHHRKDGSVAVEG